MDVEPLQTPEIIDAINDIYKLYTISRIDGDVAPTDESDNKDIEKTLRGLLKKLMEYNPLEEVPAHKDEPIFEPENRVRNIINI